MTDSHDTHPRDSVALCIAQVELWRTRYEEAALRTPRDLRAVQWTNICLARLNVWNKRLRWEANARLQTEEQQLG